MIQKPKVISVVKANCYHYPSVDGSFRPNTAFPEYPFEKTALDPENEIYSAVRESLHLLGLDNEHYGTREWNPLKDYIRPGNCVLIKPNMVREKNLNAEGGGTDCLYTHPAVVAPMVDYAIIALKGIGKIVIGDAPVQECDFEVLVQNSGYKQLVDWYSQQGYQIELVDLRGLKSVFRNGVHFPVINSLSPGKVIDLGKESAFYGADRKAIENFRITNYDPALMKQHHTLDKHEYFVSDYMLNADCIINMPKPKSHAKAGVTLSLKNMVGINVRKEYLPHHTMGSAAEGGDEYRQKNPIHLLRSKLLDKRNTAVAQEKYKLAQLYRFFTRVCSLLLKVCKERFSAGSWYGNQTISKTIADLNKIVCYVDKNGKLCSTPQRKMIVVADMIISGEKEGPLYPSPKAVGMIAAGLDPLSFDEAICTLMGFDPRKVPTFQAISSKNEDIHYVSNSQLYNGLSPSELKKSSMLNFTPASGWKGFIEMEENEHN